MSAGSPYYSRALRRQSTLLTAAPSVIVLKEAINCEGRGVGGSDW